MRRPIRCGPLSTKEALCRSSCGRPPVTLRPSWRSARRVAGPAGAVGGQPVVALEGAQAHLGLRAEDAVDRAGVVAELVQPLLQVDDVVAAHGPLGVVAEQPVTERPAGLVERAVGLLAHPAVHRQAADLLEVADGELGGGVELRGLERAVSNGVGRSAQRDGVERPASASPSPSSAPRRPRLRSAARTSATAGPRSPSLQDLHTAVGSHRVPIVVPAVPPSGPIGVHPDEQRAHPSGVDERARPVSSDGPCGRAAQM